jgi:hypothetical protein
VRAFSCDVCGNLLAFENSACVVCGTAVGYSTADVRLVPVGSGGGLQRCSNQDVAGCSWLVEPGGGLCLACRLTRTRPADSDAEGLAAFVRTERAKRRLVYQLLDLGLPVVPRSEHPEGLAFDLLSSAESPVVTGHADGVVTIDLAEGHDAHREAMRVQMGEPYRTLLGHLRHESGHYYWQLLVSPSQGPEGLLARFRGLFGDDRADYAEALRRHYDAGPLNDWGERHVSAYAAAHPWEDWAETFAHYLHIRDALQTASAYGMVVTGPEVAPPDPGLVAVPREGADDVAGIVRTWLALTYALNAVNRSMGKDDLYPFVLTPPVIEKLGFVHTVVSPAAKAEVGTAVSPKVSTGAPSA